MSTFNRETKHPETGKWEVATWIDDFYGQHRYGVRFPDGKMYNPENIDLETKCRDEVEKEEKETEKSQNNPLKQ